MNNPFQNGSVWLRTDFHLHTRADKEFSYSFPEDMTESNGNFAKDYVKRLQENDVGIGIITNHNKFDLEEFKAIRDRARRENILMLAGVELSVKDGSNAIHCLIVFSDSWWSNQQKDYIDTFLNVVFEDIPNREHENTTCKYNLSSVLQKLKDNKHKGRDSFIVMAHVEDRSGLWKEITGNRRKDTINEKLFQEFVLGFQKVRTYDETIKWENIYNNHSIHVPAYVEGSDCKSIEQVGTPHTQNDADKISYLKIGQFSFEAVKFALKNHQLRLSKDTLPQNTHSYIESVEFIGGKLDGKSLTLNENLNCLIGLPGSGKSSIIETIRYVLGFELDSGDRKVKSLSNRDYKEKLVEHFMGSGGKVIITVKNKQGRTLTIERTFGDQRIVKNDIGESLTIDIHDIISFLYFGQKDLTYQFRDDFNYHFLYRFLEKDLKSFEKNIEDKEKSVKEILSKLNEIDELKDQRDEKAQELGSVSENLRIYRENEIDKKMQRQEKFEDDITFVEQVIKDYEQVFSEFCESLTEKKEHLTMNSDHVSLENTDEIDQVGSITKKLDSELEGISKLLASHLSEGEESGNKVITPLREILKKIKEKEAQFKHEFEEIRRQISAQGFNADNYPKLTKRKDLLTKEIADLDEKISNGDALIKSLQNALSELRKAWDDEREYYKKEIENINEKGLQVSVVFQKEGNKKALVNLLKSLCRGSRIQESKYNRIVNEFNDVIDLWNDLHQSNGTVQNILTTSNQFSEFKNRCIEKKSELLTFKIPYSFDILYQGHPIEKHSDGQRASALILFTLGIGKQDLLIIDQPEDDLNSGDIYDEIVTTLVKSKGHSQFLFATHDANITVLGDCELVACCNYFDNTMNYESGSIDNETTQNNIIHVMEGGKDAFIKRNEVYSTWRQLG